MRRWFALLLIALLPIQFSWAAVAAYCGHESNVQAQHWGHHEHQHTGTGGTDTPPDVVLDGAADAEPSAGLHVDCGHCHASCAGLPVPASALSLPALAAPAAAHGVPAARSLAPTPPERPQWQPLA